MSLFKRRPNEERSEPVEFDEWKIVTVVNGQNFEINGWLHSFNDPAEIRRYVEAMNQGLLDAGFESMAKFIRRVDA